MMRGRNARSMLVVAMMASGWTPFLAQAPLRLRLPNGIDVVMTQANRAPKVEARVVVDLHDTDVATAGLDRLAGRAIGATLTEPDSARAALVARYGAAFASSVDDGRLTITAEGLADGVTAMIVALAHVVREPALTGALLERARLADRRVTESVTRSPQQRATRTLWTTLDPRRADRDSLATLRVSGATLAELAQFTRTHLVPTRTRVFVTGRFDAAAARRALEKAFGSWVPMETGALRTAPASEPTRGQGTTPVLVPRPNAPESSIGVGILIPVDRADGAPATLDVVDAILGAAVFSRITMNIREQKGYAYSPASSIVTDAGARLWVELADVAREKTGAALGEILAEIARLGEQPVTDDELRGAQEYVIGKALFDRASRAGLADQLSGAGGRDPDASRFAQRVRRVSVADVQTFAREHMARAQLGIVVVGDADALPAQLAPYGYVKNDR